MIGVHFCWCVVLQAENAIDRMDWMDKITGVIASLLNNQVPEQVACGNLFYCCGSLNACGNLGWDLLKLMTTMSQRQWIICTICEKVE